MPVDGSDFVQDAGQLGNVLRCSAVHHVDVSGRERHALKHTRQHPHNDDFYLIGGELMQDLIEARVRHSHTETAGYNCGTLDTTPRAPTETWPTCAGFGRDPHPVRRCPAFEVP